MYGYINAESSFFVMLDIQERLIPAIDRHDEVVRNAVRLMTAARELNVPVIMTEQYPKGIGPTVPEISAAVPESAKRFEKITFSCFGADGFEDAISDTGRELAVVFGIETHICVLATMMDMVDRGMRVVLAADASGSRTRENHELALTAARDYGVLVVPTETVVYHMLERAGTPQFKALLPLFK